MILGYFAAKWSSGDRPLRPWKYGFVGRLLACLIGMAVVNWFPKDGVTPLYFVLVIGATVLSSFFNTMQFVGMGSFFTSISDPAIGGTYMTLLNTLSNLGGTWPKYFVLLAVEYYTKAPCSIKVDGFDFQCGSEMANNVCSNSGGTCHYITDGYYIVNWACFFIGLLTFLAYIKPTVQYLEKLPKDCWIVVKGKIKND